MDEPRLRLKIYFASQVVDVHVYEVGHGFGLGAPAVLEDGGAVHGFTRVAHQTLEDGEFLGRETDDAAGTARLAVQAVEFEIGDAQDGGRSRTAAAQEGADASGELIE